MLFNSDFANNTILSCFFFFFLIINICFLIPAVIAQIFNPIAELVIPIGIPNKEPKAEIKIEIHLLTAEAKIRKCSISFVQTVVLTEISVVQTYLCFLLIHLFWFISLIK